MLFSPGLSRATAAQGQVWLTRNSQALGIPRLTVPEDMGREGAQLDAEEYVGTLSS